MLYGIINLGFKLFDEPEVFGVLFGGNVNNTTNAGVFYFNVNNSISNTNATIGFRTSVIYINLKSIALAKNLLNRELV